MGLLDNALQAIKNQYQETKGNVGLLMSDPKQYMSGLNQDAAEYNRLSSLALQAERNAYRGLPVSAEQTAAKQYIDQQQQDMALGFTGSIKAAKPTSALVNEAHRIASINAEKMLGLPPGNTAMDRARAMGYDMTMYHGTDTPVIEAFDPEKTKIIKGVFSTNNPKTASKYAEEAGLKNRAETMGMESSPNVLPLLIKSESHTRLPKFDKQTIDQFKSYGDKGVYRDEMGVAVTFDPSQIRSRFAAFDPARANEADLLAGVVPLGLIAGKDQLELKKEKKPKK
jgi:hypothetical protein